MAVLSAKFLIPAISCLIFCISYAFIIQPLVLYIFGFRKAPPGPSTDKRKASVQDFSHPSAPFPSQSKEKGSGIISIILPFYALGIFMYLVYTVAKVLNNRRKVNPVKKEKYLKDYYRNFRYIPEKGKFQMDSDSSNDERGNGLRNCKPGYDIGWSPVPEGADSVPDIYRSTAGLPKDLEYLLKRAEEDNLDNAELHRLRTRLEQMEEEMVRLLKAVQDSTNSVLSSSPSKSANSKTLETPNDGDEDEVLYSAEED